jgi:BlaI family penicillinase repressor
MDRLAYFYYEKIRTMRSKPSDSELEIMQVLWEKGALTVREVNDHLNKRRRVGYTTTLKIMQIMTDKGMLTRDTGQRSHIYTPVMKPEEVQSSILDHVIRTAFMGNTSSMVLRALGQHQVSPEEMEEIKAIIEKMEKRSRGDI